MAPLISENVPLGIRQREIADRQRIACPPERQQAAVEYQHGLRVSHLLLDIALRPIGIERQPRRNGAESRKGMGVPWHGRTNRIAAQSQPRLRSEEPTSELQSLMRISYAVFCLKKKKKN